MQPVHKIQLDNFLIDIIVKKQTNITTYRYIYYSIMCFQYFISYISFSLGALDLLLLK